MDLQELGQKIAQHRRDEKVSQQQLAHDVGISRATINALENNRAGDVGIRKIIKLLDYFGKELHIRDKSPFPTFEELRDEN